MHGGHFCAAVAWALLQPATGQEYFLYGKPIAPGAGGASVHNVHARREQLIATRLLSHYDETVRPGKSFFNDTGDAVVVNVTVEVLSLSSFDDVHMEFTGQLKFQQEWFDKRLVFRDAAFRGAQFINLAVDQPIWHPDTFFQNEQDGHGHDIDQPNHIEFGSYAYTTDDIIYEWSSLATIVRENVSESLPKFSITGFVNESCASSTATGTYGCLRIRLFLQREFSYFLLQLYIPSCMLVMVACLSFWIDWRSAPSRVPLTIVTLLTITTQASGINAKLPPVSYTKAIDVWIGACVVFIFGSLIEYAIVNYIGSNEEKIKAKCRPKSAGAEPSGLNGFLSKLGLSNPAHAITKSDALLSPAAPSRVADVVDSTLCSLRNGAIETADERANGAAFLRAYSGDVDAEEATAPFRRGEAHGASLRQRLKDRLRGGRAYRRQRAADWEEGGDCFRASEYVQFRRDQHRRAVEAQERSHGRWARLRSGFESAGRAERIDILSRALFPLGFMGFNLCYWALYLPGN